MTTKAKIKSEKTKMKGVGGVSTVLAILALISSLPYLQGGFLGALTAFLLPLVAYLIISWKFGTGSILKYLSNLEFVQKIYASFSKLLRIKNLDQDIISGSATKKTRLVLTGIIVFLILMSVLAPFPLDLKLGVVTVYAPLVYVVLKGYRLSIITLFAIKMIDTIGFLLNGINIVSGLLWFVVLSTIYLYTLYVEDRRVKLEESGKMKAKAPHNVRDSLITIALYIACFAIMVVVIAMKMSAMYQQ